MKVKTQGHRQPPPEGTEITCPHPGCRAVLVVEATDRLNEEVGSNWWIAYCVPTPEGCGQIFLVNSDGQTKAMPSRVRNCQRPGCGKRLDPLTTGQDIVRLGEKQREVCTDCRNFLVSVGWTYRTSAKELLDPAADTPVVDYDTSPA